MVDIDIAKLKAGDRAQWDAAWADLYGHLAYICADFAMTLGSGPVEEHLQESFFKLNEELGTGRIETYTHARRWVRKAVLNALRDEVDRLKTEKHGGGRLISFQEFLDSESGEDPEDPTQRRTILRPDETKLGTRILPDEAAHRLLLAAYLDELLAQIPPQQANVLRDDFLADLNHNAIAKKRGIKLGSVGVLRQRGLNALLLRTASRDKVLWDTKAPARPKPRKRHEPKEAN